MDKEPCLVTPEIAEIISKQLIEVVEEGTFSQIILHVHSHRLGHSVPVRMVIVFDGPTEKSHHFGPPPPGPGEVPPYHEIQSNN